MRRGSGPKLFDRRSRPPKPTPLGLEFFQETLPLIVGFDRALERLRGSADLARGTLRIGASRSAISEYLAPAISSFRRLYPDVTITVVDHIAEHLAAMVSDRKLDFAIAGRARTSDDIEQIEIASDPFGLACRFDHRLLQLDRPIVLADIDAATVIDLDDETGTAALLADHSGLPASFRNGAIRAHSTIGQLCLIRSGVGLGLLPRNAVMLFNDPALRFAEISDFGLVRRLYLLKPARHPTSHVAERFLAILHGKITGHPGHAQASSGGE